MTAAKYTSLKFRSEFNHLSNNVFKVFAMHMAKGMLKMRKSLKDIDFIVEVHDARIPLSGRNLNFQDSLMIRPHLLLLNKIDLIEKKDQEKIIKHLKKDTSDILFTCCKNDINHTIRNQLLPSILKMTTSNNRYHRSETDDYNVLIIGIPNVGKSSIINALRNIHLNKGGKAAPVGALPGVTKSLMEKIKVSERPKVFILDTPGVLPPHIPDMNTAMKLILCANIKEKIVGPIIGADYLLFMLNKLQCFQYVDFYNIGQPIDNIYEFLSHLSIKLNLIINARNPDGGYIKRPNLDQASHAFIRDFRTSKLGLINLDRELLEL